MQELLGHALCRLDRNRAQGRQDSAGRLLYMLVPVRPSAVRRRGVVEGDAPAVGLLKRPRVAPGALHSESHTIFRQRIYQCTATL